jgi:hypothetical protein
VSSGQTMEPNLLRTSFFAPTVQGSWQNPESNKDLISCSFWANEDDTQQITVNKQMILFMIDNCLVMKKNYTVIQKDLKPVMEIPNGKQIKSIQMKERKTIPHGLFFYKSQNIN